MAGERAGVPSNALAAGPLAPDRWLVALDGVRVVTIGVGMLLLAGLWTPIAGTIAAIIAVWHVFSQPGDPWSCIMLGTLGAALALLGPGGWSVDARLFGWKRIEPPERKS